MPNPDPTKSSQQHTSKSIGMILLGSLFLLPAPYSLLALYSYFVVGLNREPMRAGARGRIILSASDILILSTIGLLIAGCGVWMIREGWRCRHAPPPA